MSETTTTPIKTTVTGLTADEWSALGDRATSALGLYSHEGFIDDPAVPTFGRTITHTEADLGKVLLVIADRLPKPKSNPGGMRFRVLDAPKGAPRAATIGATR